MPKRIAPLTELQVKNAKPQNKSKKLFDGGGLFLLVTPAGGKLWHFKYRFGAKEKKLSFGSYPTVSLTDARKQREDTRRLLVEGNDPGEVRKAVKGDAATSLRTLKLVAEEWLKNNKPAWSELHYATVVGRLKYNVYDVIGGRPIAELKRGEVISLLKEIGGLRGKVATAKKVKIYLSQIFRFALNNDWIDTIPTGDLKVSEILPKVKLGHHPAITVPKEVGALLRAIESLNGSCTVKNAMRLAPLVFLRPGELRKAEWHEFDLDAGEWNIPAERMKMRVPHLVPLSTQAVEIMREMQPLTGKGRYVFPNQRSASRPMTDAALGAALRRMGYEQGEVCAHGFRATARTNLEEVLRFRIDIIEHQLAHMVKDAHGRAYNRTSYLPDRRKMMQVWADYLDGLKAGAKVIPIRSKG
jgi:integrase